jgi:hypothetical protein
MRRLDPVAVVLSAPGRVKTRARLALAFDTLVLDGEEHAIGTRAIDITADTHKKDAATIGIGAGRTWRRT